MRGDTGAVWLISACIPVSSLRVAEIMLIKTKMTTLEEAKRKIKKLNPNIPNKVLEEIAKHQIEKRKDFVDKYKFVDTKDRRKLMSSDIVKRCGLLSAEVYEHIRFWCRKNALDEKMMMFRDNDWWMYQSVKEMAKKQFQGNTDDQIRFALGKLYNAGYIKMERWKYPEKKYDGTYWYAINIGKLVVTKYEKEDVKKRSKTNKDKKSKKSNFNEYKGKESIEEAEVREIIDFRPKLTEEEQIEELFGRNKL